MEEGGDWRDGSRVCRVQRSNDPAQSARATVDYAGSQLVGLLNRSEDSAPVLGA